MELNKQALVMTSFCEGMRGRERERERKRQHKPVVYCVCVCECGVCACACAMHGNQHEKWADDGSEP